MRVCDHFARGRCLPDDVVRAGGLDIYGRWKERKEREKEKELNKPHLDCCFDVKSRFGDVFRGGSRGNGAGGRHGAGMESRFCEEGDEMVKYVVVDFHDEKARRDIPRDVRAGSKEIVELANTGSVRDVKGKSHLCLLRFQRKKRTIGRGGLRRVSNMGRVF